MEAGFYPTVIAAFCTSEIFFDSREFILEALKKTVSVLQFCCMLFQLLPSHFRIMLSLLIYADFDIGLFTQSPYSNKLPTKGRK